MSEQLNNFYLELMGIDVLLPREQENSNCTLTDLAKEVASCVRCNLSETRSQTVFARGNPEAKLMIIGEAPGFYEDKQGQPFVGKAGMLLNQMLKSIGLTEKDVYIANVLKCRPPENRDPRPEEINSCSPFLLKQIELINPHLLLALGRFAGQFLMNQMLPLNQLRQKVHKFKTIPFIVSYHPAYLLRNPQDKKKAYVDMLTVRQILETC
ncbi:uracil-DNA glycosylase [Legionella jordanis]|uniref:Type-4 uracil-DNA glycosylase n=1 Tax=Legionella jordanis TaxID=456 RepID=A0A0W0V7N0_9GAMM|nr:uracil-DNA glycosylase [Legionella jordanis]KTD16135.1 bacteriophage-like DNA polymerase [Legionella jordanis]RMX04638.1 uracil-DNA glycosylase [Legionella jordanis]VEH12405.1 bacteriophage-type DNA polymerase [Legionella jordanis]HAT8713918.1 uracil-DNA glycosylase [Legionella jordanis]